MAPSPPGREFLKALDLFSKFSDEALEGLRSRSESLTLEAGQVLFAEGAVADSLYVVVEGEVAITKRVPGGEVKRVAALGPGSVFGEMCLFSGRTKRIAGVVAAGSVSVLRIRSEVLRELFAGDTEAAVRTYKTMLLTKFFQLQQSNRELASLYELSRLMSQDLDLPRFCQAAVELLCFSIPRIDGGLLYLFEEKTGDFTRAAASGASDAAERLHFGAPLLKFLELNVLAGKIAPLLLSDDRVGRLLKGVAEAQSMVLSPSAANGKMAGFALLLNRAERLGEAECDLDLLAVFTTFLFHSVRSMRPGPKS